MHAARHAETDKWRVLGFFMVLLKQENISAQGSTESKSKNN